MGACSATKSIHVWVPTASCVAANVTVVAVRKCSAPRVRSRLTSYASTVRAAARAAALTVDAYEVSLDLTRGAEHFRTATTVTFAATQDAVGTHTWIDFVAEQAPTVTLNGDALDVADFDGARLRIGPLAAQNTLCLLYTSPSPRD